jgi:ankyrin repeat protein
MVPLLFVDHASNFLPIAAFLILVFFILGRKETFDPESPTNQKTDTSKQNSNKNEKSKEEDSEIKTFKTIDSDILLFLLKNGADINHIYNNNNGNTFLHLLIDRKDFNNTKLFIENGARLDIKNFLGKTPLDFADKGMKEKLNVKFNLYHSQEKFALNLIKAGADITEKNAVANTILHIATEKGIKSIVEELLYKNVNINAKNFLGETPLFLAVYNKQYDIVDLLIKHKANIKFSNKFKNIIHYAYTNNDKTLLEIIKKNNLKIPLWYKIFM